MAGTIGVVSQSGELEHRIGAELSNFGPDAVIADLAGRQHGVVSRAQLMAAGLGRRAIGRRIESARLHPLHRGVYAVGHQVVSLRGRWMAATLAAGGVLSHRSAGALWGLRPFNGRIDVTVPWDKTQRPGLLLHRAVLAPDEITTHEGIPVTTPARTQLDLAGVLQRHQLQQAINEAERLRLDGPQPNRHPTKRGTANLRTLAPPTHTRRDLEARFTTFLNDRRFQRPKPTSSLRGSRSTSRGRRADRRLAAAGWIVLRVTWRDLDEPGRLAAELAACF